MARRRRIYRTGEGDKLDIVPFNVDNLPRNKRTRRIFSEYGYDNWRAIFITESEALALGIGGMRATPYNTPDELVRAYAKERGILGSVRIMYDAGTDMYYAYVGGSDFAFPPSESDSDFSDEG